MTFKCLQVLLSSLLIVTGGTLSASQALNSRECELIDTYESSENTPFSERFAKMVHQREFCVSSGGECSVPLQKRIEDFYIVIKGERHIPSAEMLQISKEALANTLSQIEMTTGLNARLDKPTETENFIFLVYVDKVLAARRFEDYTAGWIVPENLFGKSPQDTEIISNLFRTFIETDLPFATVGRWPSSGVTRASQIWISVGNDERLMRQCIAEEFFLSMGLGVGTEVPSIFDYPFSHGKSDTELSDFDLLLLKFLYRDEMKAGSTRPQTIKSVSNVIRNECPAADKKVQP
jgi:hypothetical protein